MNGSEDITITGQRIYYTDKPELVIMDSEETPLMKRFSEIVTSNGGDILEIGFGMGISADFIYNSKIDSYTCIEIHPRIYQMALEWAKDKPNATILHGNWIDVIPKIQEKFDGIFMDTFEYTNYEKFESVCKSVAKYDCILSMFIPCGIHNKSMEIDLFEFQKLDYLQMKDNRFEIYYSFFNGSDFVKKSKPNKLI